MNDDDSALVVAHTSSGAEELARRVPGAAVVSAFGTIPSEVLFGVFAARGSGTPPSLLYCGDDARAKQVAAALIRDLGFDPVDAGALTAARYLEPFTMLVALLAYEGEGGPELVYRFEHTGYVKPGRITDPGRSVESRWVTGSRSGAHRHAHFRVRKAARRYPTKRAPASRAAPPGS